MKTPIRKRFRNIFAIAALLVVLLDLIRFSSVLFIMPGLVYNNEPLELIAVLTGGQGRFKEAFSFLQQNRGKVLYVSGVDEGVSIQNIFKVNGIEENPDSYIGRIYVDRIAKSTQENAIQIRKITEWLQVKSLLVVTSSYHMRRSMLKIAREMQRSPALDMKIYQWPVESPNFDRNLWWKSLTGWQILLSEYVKSRADEFWSL